MKNVLIIVRGLPGAGKNAFAEVLNTKAICCADDYMMVHGTYDWAGCKLYAAHKWCERKCERFMKAGAEKIVVANTSVHSRDMKRYVDLAEIYGYKVFSVIVENRHGGVNSHGVTEETLENMRKGFNIQL
jgi:predicted kinase